MVRPSKITISLMSKRIVILGALGYVGSELCQYYANSKHDIVAVDSNFVPDRVATLIRNKIKFYQRDIFNCRDILSRADICFNLISVTDVPQVASQETPERIKLIYNIGVEGNRKVIKYIPSECRFVFLSTHVLFEGVKSNKLNIDETREPCPLLSYGKSKLTSETDLKKSDKNYIIARLGSVYGYPALRWKILPNLFSKQTAIDGKIKIFGGNCLKPLVGISDVARALKVLAESEYNKEIFHLVNENLKVNEIAGICKKYNPNLQIKELNKEVINDGYSLSNSKLLKTGFKFRQSIDKEIGRMIKAWSNK